MSSRRRLSSSTTRMRALSLPTDDVAFSIEHGGPFPHAEQSQGPGARQFTTAHTAPVVMHFEDKFLAFLPQVNLHLGRLGVPDDVGQGLLKDAEDRGRPIRVEIKVLQGAGEPAVDARPLFKLMDLPFNRRLQT